MLPHTGPAGRAEQPALPPLLPTTLHNVQTLYTIPHCLHRAFWGNLQSFKVADRRHLGQLGRRCLDAGLSVRSRTPRRAKRLNLSRLKHQ